MGFRAAMSDLMRRTMFKGHHRTLATSRADLAHSQPTTGKSRCLRGEYVPVYVALGLITLQLVIGYHTIKHQLMYAPGVNVNKKRREMFPEVRDPDQVVDEADKFINKSFFRKVANIQEPGHDYALPDHIRKEVFHGHNRAETLKSVGVNNDHD